jgi:TolA-binding protein
MKTSKETEIIEKYIRGELTGTELISFERELTKNKSLADEVNLRKEIDKFLKNKEALELREMLDEIHEEVTSNVKNSSMQKRKGIIRILFSRWQYAAAAVIFLLAFTAVLFFTIRPSLNERLYAQYFKPLDGTSLVRSDKQEDMSNRQSAMNEYNDEHYEKSWMMLKDISNRDTADAEVYFYRGISAMEINDLNDAISSFNIVIKNSTSLYIDEATWYLALSYLKKNDRLVAETQFKKIVESNSNHKDEAQEILEKLR